MGIFRYANPKCFDFTIAFVCCFTVREKNIKNVKLLTTNVSAPKLHKYYRQVKI